MSNQPKNTLIYRMIHYQNLELIMKYGIHCPNSSVKIPEFINIGLNNLIAKRGNKKVSIKPNGVINDYVPFYFCYKSPMLFLISKDGNKDYSGSQEEIIYLVSSVEKIEEAGIEYVFTDGHASEIITKFYNTKDDLVNLDWDTINAKFWNNDINDIDRQRRKQSEFLVHNTLPWDCLLGIAVNNEQVLEQVKTCLSKYNKQIYTVVRRDWYY